MYKIKKIEVRGFSFHFLTIYSSFIFLCWKKNTSPIAAAMGRATLGISGIAFSPVFIYAFLVEYPVFHFRL